MRKITTIMAALFISTSLVACANHEDAGTITGGIVGGLIGSQFGGGSGKVAAAAAGALLGAYIGNNIGRTMDKVDRMQMEQAIETAPIGREVVWTNPDSGYTYRVVSTRTYYRPQPHYRQPCREYTTTAIIGGKKQHIYGTACRQPDGSWVVVN